MVEGTGLENQRGQPPQVRILSFPPFFMFLIMFCGKMVVDLVILI